MKDNNVVLNGQESDNQAWSVSGFNSLVHYFFKIDLSGNLKANVKFFADKTSMFLVVSDPTSTSQKLNKDLEKVALWANKWKMSFNPDSSKQAQEAIIFTEDNQTISIVNSKAIADRS